MTNLALTLTVVAMAVFWLFDHRRGQRAWRSGWDCRGTEEHRKRVKIATAARAAQLAQERARKAKTTARLEAGQ